MCEWLEGQPQDVTSTRDYNEDQTVTYPKTARPNDATFEVIFLWE